MITMFYEIPYKPCILIPVSSRLVEKCGSCARLNICKRTVMEALVTSHSLINMRNQNERQTNGLFALIFK